MEHNDQINKAKIDYFVHQYEMARSERIARRMWILIIVLIITNFATVIFNNITSQIKEKQWLDYLALYDFESYELSTDGGGDANYIGNDGVINYGEGYSQAP